MAKHMRVSFFGAAHTVTGSKFLVETESTKVLVDCGLYQGVKELRLRNWGKPPFNPEQLDAVLLTHAHIDHSGSIPLLVKNGFKGPVYCTAPTKELCKILLPDSARIGEEDAAYANRKGFSKHHPALPLYTVDDAKRALKKFKVVSCNKEKKIGDMRITFQSAGHILGATSVNIANPNFRIQFSGDIGRFGDIMENDPEPALGGNWVVMESTYGDRTHIDLDPVTEIANIVNQSFMRKGVLLIPSFAVGRTQTLLYCLLKAKKKNLIPNIPIYVNSPMATKVTNLYKDYHQWHRLDDATSEELHGLPRFVGSVEESKALNHGDGPKIIISASGMLTGGRVLHHIRRFADEPENTILLPGYQAAGTRGAALVAGARSLKIFGDYVPIHAQVIHWELLSAHADQAQLMKWLNNCQTQPQKVFLVHGEPCSSDNLRRLITEKGINDVTIPRYGESYTL